MDDIENPVTEFDEAECWNRLATQDVGRIVTHVGDVIDIFPVNYVVEGASIVLRTAEGTKLVELVITEEVLFEADAHSNAEAWSVVLRGTARRLETEAEIADAERLPLRPYLPTVKRIFVRIEPGSVSGRGFQVGPEPDRNGVQAY